MKTSLSLFCFHLISFKQCNIKMEVCLKKKLEDTNGVIRSPKSKNGQNKKDKQLSTNQPNWKPGVNSGVPKLPQVKIRWLWIELNRKLGPAMNQQRQFLTHGRSIGSAANCLLRIRIMECDSPERGSHLRHALELSCVFWFYTTSGRLFERSCNP